MCRIEIMIANHIIFGGFPAAFEKTPTELGLLRSRQRWIGGLFLGATFGLLSLIFGLGLSVLSALGVVASINTTITILLVASFPLLMFAAHCMDKVREKETLVKLEYCKRMGTYQSFVEEK